MLVVAFTQQTNDHINRFGDKESRFFLTKEDNDRFTQYFDESKSKDRLNEYQRGYKNAMVDFQR